MEADSETKSPVQFEDQPMPRPLPVSPAADPASFKEWQRLPFVLMPPAAVPPQAEDFRDWGINE